VCDLLQQYLDDLKEKNKRHYDDPVCMIPDGRYFMDGTVAHEAEQFIKWMPDFEVAEGEDVVMSVHPGARCLTDPDITSAAGGSADEIEHWLTSNTQHN
jgi:hypothetical protein